MTQNEMNILIPQKLKQIESEYGISVLWAVESGSRAWGFASPDSDFDVRFIYKRKAKDYLHLNQERDVIEMPIDETWDVSGWDLDKTLRLLNKSNPTLYEWLNSPIVYFHSDFKQRIEPLLQKCFSEEKMLYHYLSMARNNIKDHLTKEFVRPKKYFYALRPILASMWVLENHSAPPVLFQDLYDSVLPIEMKDPIDRLLDLKINAPENLEIARMKEVDSFIDTQMAVLYKKGESAMRNNEEYWDELNRFFFDEITR